MKRTGLRQIVGKRIETILIATGKPDRDMGTQIFLVFDDQTWLEIYGKPEPVSGIASGGKRAAIDYARICSATDVEELG
jgi:hypothetical protein